MPLTATGAGRMLAGMEFLYQSVWEKVFALTYVRLHDQDRELAEETATVEADAAALSAVMRFSQVKQDAALALWRAKP